MEKVDYKEVIGIFKERHENLMQLKDSAEFSSTKKREIAAAINELVLVMNTLEEKRDEQFSNVFEEEFNLENEEDYTKPGFFSKILSSISNKDSPGSFPE